MKQNIYDIVTDKRSVPFNSAGTGTIATHGLAIVGTGTLFTSEMPVGSWLIDLSHWDKAKVVRVDSDTLAFLQIPLGTDITPGTTPQIVSASKAKAKSISLKIKSTDPDGLLDNKAFSGILTIEKTGNDRTANKDLIQPIIIDGTSTSIKVDILY